MKAVFTSLICLLTLGCPDQSTCFDQKILDPADYMSKGLDTILKYTDQYLNSFIGCPVPDFEATDINGKKVSSKSLHGKVTLLNFWFTRCKPCVREFNSLNALSDSMSGDVVFISFVSDRKPVVDSFLNKRPLRFDIIPASDSLTKEVFKVMVYPTNIVVDKDWRVAAILRNGQGDESLQNYYLIRPKLEEALSKK
jgi:thiol-disulfide isomerase/thioredoxin